MTDLETLRFQLTRLQFWVLEAQFVLFAASTWLNVPALVRSLALRPRPVAAALGASLLSLTLIGSLVPQTNRIYYDEHIYQAVGQNMADLHRAQMCDEGSVEYGRLQCERGQYNKQPYGYPYMLSLLYRAAGVRESAAHWFNWMCAGLLVWVVFLTAVALWNDQRIGAYAALVAALIPQQLLWSHTAAAEPSAALMTAVALLAAVCYARLRTTRALLWMIASTVFAIQFRPESLLIVIVVVLVVALTAAGEFRQRRLWGGVALAAVLSIVHALHLYAVRGESWGSTGDRMSVEYLWSNLQVNGPFFLTNDRFPLMISALAIAGIALHRSAATLIAVVYFLLFWGVFLFFYAGSYSYGADVRFSLMCYPAVAMLAGLGAASLHARFHPLALVAALAFQFLWFTPQIRSVGEEAWAARADVEFAHYAGSKLPRNSIVLTQNPHVFLVAGVNAAQMSLATLEPDYVTGILAARYAGGVYVHWNFWCNVEDQGQRQLCANALALTKSQVVSEMKERDYRYAIYRLETGAPRMLLKTEPLQP